MAAIIEVREFPANTPEMFLEADGRLLLDIGPEFRFSLTKAPAEGNELNEIKREGTESFSVPLTGKNRWIFRRWLYPNILERDFSRLKVYAYDGVHQLPEDRLDVLRIDLVNQVVEVGLFESGELGLVDGAKNLFLNTLDFGTFELTEANLEANWSGAASWSPESDYFYFGLVHYGNWIIDTAEVSPEDFRPLLSVLGTFEKGFCALGWVFESPLLECEWAKRLWWYGLGKEYYRHTNYGMLARVDVELSTPIYTNSSPIILAFDVENIDLGGSHAVVGPQSQFTQTQPRAGFMEYRLMITAYNSAAFDQDFDVVFSITNQPLWRSFENVIPAGETVDIDIRFTEAFPQGVVLTAFAGGWASMEISSMRMTIEPLEKYYYYGDVIDVRESIDPNYTFLQFLQGFAHMGFRFDIDRGRKTVKVLPPELVDIFGEGEFEGYYRPAESAKDMRDLVVADSAVVDFPKEDIPETLIVGFAKSGDKYIESLEIPEDEPLYAKRLTFLTGVRGQVEYSENPFFEPTANYLWFGGDKPQISSPAMWDNDEGHRSFEIGPRLLYAEGLVEQTGLVEGVTQAKGWSYLGAMRTTLPYVFQVPGSTVGTPPTLPGGYIVYDDGTYSQYTIWKMFLQKDNRFFRDLPTVEMLFRLGSVDYHKFSFRDRVWVELLGRPTVFKVLAVRDFQSGEDIPTPLTLQIDPREPC